MNYLFKFMNNDRFKFRAWNGKVMREVAMIEFDDTGRTELIKVWDHPSASTAKIKGHIDRWKKKDCILIQSTGLKDKAGVLIFEGDILKVSYAHGTIISEVKLYSEYGIFALKEKPHYYQSQEVDRPMGSSGSSTGYKPYTWKTYRKIEIIGNIFENSELLNKENDAK